MESSSARPHQRYNPLNDSWVLVCPNRAKRPWQGHVHKQQPSDLRGANHEQRSTDSRAKNPLAPGATRANGKVNPMYDGVYVFPNDFPALLPADEGNKVESFDEFNATDDLFVSKDISGHCEVMCFHPRSDLTVALMTQLQIKNVIDNWCLRLEELSKTYKWVQIFENKGQIMGCSNPHPHCQIWASDFLPQEPAKEDLCQKRYMDKHGSVLLLDYATKEVAAGVRTIARNEDWVALVPYWALWPYEAIVIPLRHRKRLTDLSDEERLSLADIMKQLTVKYDNLFHCSFPYSMGFHGAPSKGQEVSGGHDCDHWQLHLHYFPPLLRSASVQKFMVGYEMLAQPQRDITPEMAAEMLKMQCSEHYSQATTKND